MQRLLEQGQLRIVSCLCFVLAAQLPGRKKLCKLAERLVGVTPELTCERCPNTGQSGGATCWASQFQCSVSQQTINNRLGLLLKGCEEFLIFCLSVITALVCLESLLLILLN